MKFGLNLSIHMEWRLLEAVVVNGGTEKNLGSHQKDPHLCSEDE